MTKAEIGSLLFILHGSTFRNEKQIEHSEVCGCFNCLEIFSPELINQWCDTQSNGDKTALCPYCGIDSVLGDACGVDVTPSLLWLMNEVFFGDGLSKLEDGSVSFIDEEGNDDSD